MAGQNAFAFNGTAFVPEDRNLTAGISAWTSPTTRTGIARAYNIVAGQPASRFWLGFPPQPQVTVTNSRTGTFPNLVNSILLDWTIQESSLTTSFTVFAQRGTGAYTAVATVDASLRQYRYGSIDPDITYNFYVRANSASGLSNSSQPKSISLPSPGLVGALGSSSTSLTATVSWTVPAGVYQRFRIFDATTDRGTVNATQAGTNYSFSRSSLAEGTQYVFRVYGINYDGFIGPFREITITTQTMPVPSLSWNSISATTYSGFQGKWTGVAGITYQPQTSTDNATWTNLGGAQSGSGDKTTDSISPGYASIRYMRLSVTNGEVTKNSNTISVTPGRAYVPGYRWGAEQGPYFLTYNVTTNRTFDNSTSITDGTSRILWGNRTVWSLQSTTTSDHRVDLFRIRGYREDTSKSMTADGRRLYVNLGTSGARRTDFDNKTNGEWVDFGDFGYQNTDTDRQNRAIRYWGYSDVLSYYDRTYRIWRYGNSNTGPQQIWHTAVVNWQAEFRWYSRQWEEYTLVSQVNTTWT